MLSNDYVFIPNDISNRSRYDIIDIAEKSILIKDKNEGDKSVTNDAERVTEELYAAHGDKRIFQIDTNNELDELVHENGVFKEFKPNLLCCMACAEKFRLEGVINFWKFLDELAKKIELKEGSLNEPISS